MARLRSLVRLLRPVYRAAERKICLRALPHFTPIDEFQPDDVFIVGYPKSGNTWVQNLVAGVIYGVDPEYAPDTLIQELVPDVHYKRYYKRFRTPMFFKSHHLPRPDYRRVVYLLRDGRDVMVSYFHHLTALKGKEVRFLDMARRGVDHPFGKWHEHVEAWLSNPYNATMLVIKYEGLKVDPVTQLRNFCQFVEIDRSDQLLEKIVQAASFENLRKKEALHGGDNPVWPRHKAFFRRGQIGSWKNEMPEEVLKAFLCDASDTLRKCGYDL